MKMSAKKLVKNCRDDIFPDDSDVYSVYGFNNCRNEEEYSYLFGLYKEMIKIRGFSEIHLQKWTNNSRVGDYIDYLFSQGSEDNFYYQWFQNNKKIINKNSRNFL